MTGQIVFLLKGYPRLSETFIAQEIRSLEQAGLPIAIWALRRPTDARTHPVHREIEAPVAYLPEYLHDAPITVLASGWRAVRLPGFGRAVSVFLRDLAREPSRNRIRRFGQACVLAVRLPRNAARIHAHFIHTPASVARYASLMRGLAWSISAHAKDIWTSPDWDLRQKLAEADWVVTCTKAGLDRLDALAPPGRRPLLVYHGVDLGRFPALVLPRPERDGANARKPVRLLTVARAVEKKGIDVLIEALSRLPRELSWTWTHVGGGSLAEDIKRRAADHGLGDRCDFLGARDQTEILALYRGSDLFVLPCRIAGDGDRDGLPNVLMEASSQGLAVLSTTVSGVTELIADGVNGALVPPDDPHGLAARMAALIRDPALRHRLGKAAMARVRANFDHAATTAALRNLFERGRVEPVDDAPHHLEALP